MQRSEGKGTEQRYTAVDPVALFGATRNFDVHDEIRRVARCGQSASSCQSLVHWAVIDTRGWPLPVLLRLQPDDREVGEQLLGPGFSDHVRPLVPARPLEEQA